jgi:hypothetical protein
LASRKKIDVLLRKRPMTECYARKTHRLLQVCRQSFTNLFTSCRQVVFALLVPSCCINLDGLGQAVRTQLVDGLLLVFACVILNTASKK